MCELKVSCGAHSREYTRRLADECTADETCPARMLYSLGTLSHLLKTSHSEVTHLNITYGLV